jgi:hypothetical protein
MVRRSFGTTLLAGAFLTTGLAGLVASWAVWPRTSNTSPLMALFALTWGCTHVVTAVLTWQRSRFAGPAFVGAVALLLLPERLIVPGGQLFLPSFVTVLLSLSSAIVISAGSGHAANQRTDRAAQPGAIIPPVLELPQAT